MNVNENPKSNKKALILSLIISIGIYLILTFVFTFIEVTGNINLNKMLLFIKPILITLFSVGLFVLIFLLLSKKKDINKNIPKTEMDFKNFRIKYKALAEISKDAVFITTLGGRIIECNKIACNMFDYNKADLIGMYVRDLLPDNNAKSIPKILSNKLNYELTYFEAKGKKHDGSTFPLEANVKIIDVKNEPLIISCVRDISRDKKTEKQIQESIEEREILIKEVHHRVKNNLQIISSLINLQTRYLSNNNSITQLRETKNRVISMALIHEILYQSESVSRINFQKYIDSLVEKLSNTYKIDPDKINIEVKADNIYLNLQKGIPCSLIMNELISNSFKYAFPEGREGKGQIIVSLTKKDDEYTLIIKDNGIGLPPGVDFDKTKSVGLQLVHVLTLQIKGEIDYKSENGAEFILKFKEDNN